MGKLSALFHLVEDIKKNHFPEYKLNLQPSRLQLKTVPLRHASNLNKLFSDSFSKLLDVLVCNGQYTMMRPPKSNTCDNRRSTVLVEQFFNLIFSEFQNPPPVCVCVQMCIEQAAYCYPNGCLKRLDKRIEGSTLKPVNRIQYGTTQSLMFVVDKDPDFDDIFEVTSLKANSG